MNIIKPKKLKKGDTIGILTPSGPIENKENIFRAKKYFENKGYKVVLAEHIFDKNYYIAGKEGFEVDKALYPVSLEKILRI